MLTLDDVDAGQLEVDPGCSFKHPALVAVMDAWSDARGEETLPRHNTIEDTARNHAPEFLLIADRVPTEDGSLDGYVFEVGAVMATFYKIRGGIRLTELPDTRTRTLALYETMANLQTTIRISVTRTPLAGGDPVLVEQGIFPLAGDGEFPDRVVCVSIITGHDQ